MKCIESLYVLASVLCIVPAYNFKDKKLRFPLLSVASASFFLVVLFSSTIWSVVGKIEKTFPYVHKVVVICQSLIFCGMIIASNLILISSLANRKKWAEFLGTFHEIDVTMNYFSTSKGFLLKIELLIGHCFLVAVLLYEALLSKGFSIENYKYILHIRFMYYFLFVVSVLICNFAWCIEVRYKRFNILLKNSLGERKRGTENVETLRVEELAHVWIKLKKLVDLFNVLLGFIILSLLGYALIVLLYVINLFVIFVIGGLETIGSKPDMNEHYIVTYFLFGSMILVSSD